MQDHFLLVNNLCIEIFKSVSISPIVLLSHRRNLIHFAMISKLDFVFNLIPSSNGNVIGNIVTINLDNCPESALHIYLLKFPNVSEWFCSCNLFNH